MTESSELRFGGMTVNERLGLAGLLSEFGQAARRRDRAQMVAILRKVALTAEQAAWTADAVLENPAYYGY